METQISKPGLSGEIVDTQARRIGVLADALDNGQDLTNSLRGARILRVIGDLYDADPDDHETAIRDALSDIRHACDLLGLAFHDADNAAQGIYSSEVHEEGPAPDISEGWT